MAAKRRQRTGIRRATDKDSDGLDASIRFEQLWDAPMPLVPFPHRSKQVTAWGFMKDDLNYTQKWLTNMKERTESVMEVERTVRETEDEEPCLEH